jgi:hypothetical protein
MTKTPTESSIWRAARSSLARFSSQQTASAWYFAAYWLVVTAALFAIFRNWAYDDPFITYRYAHNLAQGMGFTYNPGERILSTTTPLFALLLAIPAAIYPNIPRVANLIGAASIALGGLLLWDLGKVLNRQIAAWAGLLLYPTFFFLAMTIGSETPLYLAFCLGAFAAFAREKYALSAAACAMALLTRPDGALVPIMLALAYLPDLRRRPIPWRAVLIFLAIAVPWYLFSWIYFGSPIPATLAAKQEQARLANSVTFTPGFLNVLKWFQDSPVYWFEALLALAGAAWIVIKDRRWWPFMMWPVIYFFAYHFLQVSTYYWYYVPLVPPFLAACGLGIEVSSQSIQALVRRRGRIVREQPVHYRRYSSWVPWAAASLLLAFVGWQFSDLWRLHLSPDRRIQAYQQAGHWLEENTPQDATVATLEIGIIGYYAGRYMIDFAGLLQPEITAQLANSTNYDKLAAHVSKQYQPDFLVVRKGSSPELENSYIASECQTAHRIAGESYGYPGNILIYDCR